MFFGILAETVLFIFLLYVPGVNGVFSGLPPKTPFTPGTYNKKMNKIVSANTPKNMCLLKPE